MTFFQTAQYLLLSCSGRTFNLEK